MDEEAQAPINPSIWRLVAAFFFAPFVAALLLAIFAPAYEGLDGYFERIWRTALTVAIVGAYPTTLLIGVPTFLFLRDRIEPTAVSCSLTGAAIAGFPWLIVSTLFLPDSASFNGQPTVVDGSLTAHGWLRNLALIGQISLFGLIGGYSFWLIATGGRRRVKVG